MSVSEGLKSLVSTVKSSGAFEDSEIDYIESFVKNYRECEMKRDHIRSKIIARDEIISKFNEILRFDHNTGLKRLGEYLIESQEELANKLTAVEMQFSPSAISKKTHLSEKTSSDEKEELGNIEYITIP